MVSLSLVAMVSLVVMISLSLVAMVSLSGSYGEYDWLLW